MSKWEFWKKKRRNQETEVLPWGQGYEPYMDTTRPSLFAAGEDDWDLTNQKPVFSSRPDGSGRRTYEDFLRARSSPGRAWDGPYGSSSGGYRRFYEENETRGGQPLQRIMQVLGAVVLIGGLYFVFHSQGANALRMQAYVKQTMSQDSNVQALSGWWQHNVSDKVALPTLGQVAGSSQGQGSGANSQSEFVLPVQGTVKTPYDGTTQQGVTFTAAPGSEVKSAGQGMVEKVEKSGKEDFTVTINNGTVGKTIYRHLASVSVAVNDWVDAGQTIGVLTQSGTSASLFFAYEKDGSFVNPDQILQLPAGR